MWAYRLDKANNPYGMTRSVNDMRQMIANGPDDDPTTITLFNFDRDVDAAKNMARSLGWDGIASSIKCYLSPGPDSFMVGFIITQATSAQRFLISPVPLDFMKDHIDWNYHTSTEEVSKARAALSGTEIEKPPLHITEWSRSRKGNMFCFINGAQVTVFSARDGGYKAIIASADGQHKVFTRSFQTELDCATYVPKNFYELIKEWGLGANAQSADNPFAGIAWDDDPAF